MKNICRILPVMLAVLLLTGCTGGDTLELDETFLYPLKIGALEYQPLSDEEPYANEHTSRLVYLRPGDKVTVRSSCMYGDMMTVNINLHFAYEGGTCTVTSPDNDIQMAMRDGAGCLYNDYAWEWDTWKYAYEHEIHNTGWIGINPLGAEHGHFWYNTWEEEREANRYKEMPVGRECFLTVEAFDFTSGQKAVTAKLRICQLPSEREPGKKSSYFEIELVEYELSDTYKMMLQ